MSESEVTQIRDEDVLRRMWQQTEDFGRKKEIRAHMYKLREERLRDLYSPEPTHQGKGCEFSAAHAQGHGQSFADQTFQSMKSKEVRDASSPPKEFSYRGQDLKELSNAGWNVESEDRTADDGRTHVKFVNANIEGRYDVEGGQGQFAAVDRQRSAVTEHQDANSSLRRDETSSDTAAHEHVARQTDDGTRISSTTSSSNTSSKIQQVSSTTQKVQLEDDYDLRRSHDTNRNERVTKITNNDNEQNLRTNDSSTLRKNNSSTAELVSRKVEYPDDNTKVIVETRLMPDGTRVTSTRREFRVPAQSSRSEFQSSQSKSYSSRHKSDYRDSTSNTRHTTENSSNDIVDSQRNVDDHDFKRQLREYTSNDNDDCSTKQHHVSRTTRKVTDQSHTNDELSQKRYETRVNSKVVDQHQSTTNRDDHTQTQRRIVDVDQSTINRDDHTQTQRRFIDVDQSIINRDDHTQTQRRIVDVDQSTINRDDHTQTQRRFVDVDQSTINRDDHTQTQRRIVDVDRSTINRDDHTQTERHIVDVDRSTINRDDQLLTKTPIVDRRNDHLIDSTDRHRSHDIKHNIVKETRHIKDSEERVHNISMVKKDNEEIICHVSRGRMVPDDKDHESPSDRSIPVDRVHGVPKNSTPTTEKTRDIPRDRTVPVGEATPRNETRPVERFRDAPRDGIVPEGPRDISKDRTATNEKDHPIKRDTKVEEVIERKTSSDHYQTTYQNDFQSRKISTEWSPTHQAWASTLRSDTPSTTRPSTRASSPGSKTFKSSTSSLRSSVSPDKSYRKPSSRGGSPNKMDRSSPTRTVTSDRYSSTHSTHSVTAERINKNTSPERKPPSGRSPARPGYSPDRKPQDSYRQRTSVSPEKSPKNFSDRPNSSPEKKTSDKRPRTTSPLGKKETYQPTDENPSDSYPHSPYQSTSSPERKHFDHPDRSSQRFSHSPDRRNGYQKPTDSNAAGHPRTTSPSRPNYPTNDSPRKSGVSPDRKPGSHQPSTQPKQQPNKSGEKYFQDSPIKRSSTSPDRKPNYMRPTASSQPDDIMKKTSKPEHDPDRKSPSKQVPTQISDQKLVDFSKTTKIKEDHYRFVDEETKVHYTHTDRKNVNNKVEKTSIVHDSRPRDKSPSSESQVPSEDSPDYCKTPKIRESPFNKDKSPTKDTGTIIENDELYGRVDKSVITINTTSKHDKETDENTTTKRMNKNKEHPEVRHAPSRETSPSKYGTYDKKKLRKEVDATVVSTITSKDTKDVEHESMTHRDKTSFEKVVDIPTFPSKKSPRDSISPMKSPTKDTKYKHTTDFISTEKTTEEVNKKTTTKDRPRQLVTPSSSPTRKPKTTETEPSTGQSSPTTSVSGFIYFGSPRTEKPVVTDLDEFYPDSEIPEETTKRPETLDVTRSPSPSKIPCRSPSPEKQVPTTKDNLPRKSSLKKPSTEFNQTSPVEKPPTSFRVSPTDDKPDVVDHKVVKKGQTSEPETGEPVIDVTKSSKKPKPPLQRRETYDDRCKKILGLVDDTTTETTTKETRKYTRNIDSNQNSPSVSPCESPAPNDSLPLSNYPATKKTTKVDVVDFITHERADLSKTTVTNDQLKTETPSKDRSPTKLQNIKTKTNIVTDKTTEDEVEEDTVTKTVIKRYPSPRQSPEKVISQDSPDAVRDFTQKRPDENTERKRIPSPSRPTEKSRARSDLSPERKSIDKYPKDTPPIRTSPEKPPGYNKMTATTVTSTFDVSSISDDIKKTTTKITKTSQPSRVLESPTRETPKSTNKLPEQIELPGTIPPAKQQPEDGSLVRKTLSPERKIKSDLSPHQSEPKDVRPHDSRPREITKKVPGYMKSTTAVTSKFDSHYSTEDVDETHRTRTQEERETTTKASSSTRQTPCAESPTKSSQPSDNYPNRRDTSPQRKPAQVASTKQPNTKQEVPGYMKTTKTATTKSDKTTVSEDFQETTKSSKITVEKKHTPSGSVSPNRKPAGPKSPSDRTPSPTKLSRLSDNISIDKKSGKPQPSSPVKESPTKKPDPKNTTTLSPTRPNPQKVPSYMKTTASMTMKHEQDTSEFDVTTTEVIQETLSTPTNKKHSKDSVAPSQYTHKSTDRYSPEYLHTSTFPSRPSTYDAPKRLDSPESKTDHPSKESTSGKPSHPKGTSPTRGETPGYMKTTTAMTSKFETTSTTEDIEENTGVKNIHQKHPSEIPSHERSDGKRPRMLSPSKPTDKLSRTSATSPDRKPSLKSSVKDSSFPENKLSKHTPGESPEEPSYTKPTASITSKFDRTITTHDTEESYTSKVCEPKSPSLRKSTSPSRKSPQREPRDSSGYLTKPEEPRQLRTPSPTKKTTPITETSTDFIMSEREQEILNKVQKSLRKLSPERKEKSSPQSRERSPSKTTTSLQDLDITTSETIQTDKLTNENLTEVVEEQINLTSKVPRPTQLKDDKPKDQKAASKPSSRNVSPIKRAPATVNSNKGDKTAESPTKVRSFSPKKPASHGDRPQSPQQPKTSGIKPREQIPPHLTRKPTPASLSTTKIERITVDVKKTNGALKQNVFTKNSSSKITSRSIPSPTGKLNEPDTKHTPYPRKDNVSPKKDPVTRTASDTAMKPKKTSSPQRMKSKPEIQVSDMSTKSPKSLKPTIKEPHSKLPSKPKSATSLNTAIDDDDIIIDVQQSKSSRENSPDRICPTPINFDDDVGIPRFPDEVSEPDDELVKRNHHTIHETESVVDDIVEICEDEELFVKKSDMAVITEHDDSLLSVNEKVNKFTGKTHLTKKLKDTTMTFKNTERRVNSDFIDETLKSDECLLTVSEKVNKFAKGPKDTKGSRSPSRKITDEYDRDTVYTDDYTKLSVNDKAHLFVETAENIKTTKVKPAQKVERPDFSNVDESLKTDDCLLSVSDKVNKFVKTSEQYFTETHEVEDKETKIKQHQEKIMRQIIDDGDEETYRTKETVYTHGTRAINDNPTKYPEDISNPQKEPQHAKEPKLSQPKVKDYGSPNTKPVDRVPAVKITTLRSSEAVKKAKALFENIASSQKTTQKETTQTTKTTKLTDIGVTKKSPKTDSINVLPSVENVSPRLADVDSEVDIVSHTGRLSSGTLAKPQYSYVDEKPRSSPHPFTAQSPEVPRSKSPSRQSVEVTTTKTVTSRYPAATRAESPRHRPESPKQRIESPRQRTESPMQRTESPRQRPDSDKPEKVPGYLRPTKTSQIKEETKVEETEVSSRRGSGKFGVELRRTSVERSTISSERRRSVEHHQPCIEDIFDLDLLEQMLEKVTGYEQRRRIRAQIRVAKNQSEHVFETNTYTRTTKQTTSVPKSRSPELKLTKSPEIIPKSAPQRISSPERHNKLTPQRPVPDRTQPKEPITNGHTKEPTRTATVTRQRPQSPEKPAPKSSLVPRTPVRQPSPDKRRTSPSKVAPKPKGNRFNEYASAYMKKIGLKESDKIKLADTKIKKTTDSKQTVKHERQQQTVQEFTTTKGFTDRTSSKDVIEIVQTNGKRSPSPEQRQSPERKVQFPDLQTQIPERQAYSPERRTYSPERKVPSTERKAQSPDRKAFIPERKVHSPERLHQRTPSPDFKRPKAEAVKETTIKTVYDVEKKMPTKPVQEEKPSWVTNRNLKKITSEAKTFTSRKIENEKPKYRAPSPSKVISKPIDVITSSYGLGPLDANGKPLFGIKALRNGGSNFQVKGTVIRQEFHSRNGGEPEGTVSVTAYSSQPEELERLLAAQGAEPPSRIHGLAAITTTRKFGGDSGNKLINVHTKEDRASLEQFTHHDRRVEHLESRYDTTAQEFSGDTSIEEITGNTREIKGNTRIEDITGNTRRTNTKKDSNQDRADRSRKEEKVTEVKRQKVEERKEKMERREDKKTVRQSSVKSLTEKYIKSANDSGKSDRSAYPKAGLILRTTTMRDSVSSDDAHPAGLPRTDSEHSLCSVDDTEVTTTTERIGDGVRTTTTKTMHHHHHPSVTTHTRGSTVVTHHEPVVTTRKTVVSQEPVITTRKTMVISQEPVITTKRSTVVSQEPVTHRVTQGRQGSTITTERSFLDSSTKVSGVQDILTRMKNADVVIQEGDTTEDSEARALLNKFLGATVLMAGMQGYVAEQPEGKVTMHQETVRSSSGGGKVTSRSVQELDLDQCWDETLLKQLLDECTDYEQRRRLRARIRTLMAEQEACASAVTEALGACGANETAMEGGDGSESREEEELTVTSSMRRDSSDKTVSSSTTTTTCKVTEMSRAAPKPVSPFAKFRQLEKQNSTNSPNSPKSPQSPGSPSQPFFKFTDPALQCSALTIKERLLQWCRDKTRDYENVKLENFSTSWADGLAFCALVHHFLPTAFDYSKLTPDRRRHNFTLAFKVADEKAGIYPLLDVDDMVAMRKPDWKCVFTYVQAIYRRFKDEP